MGSAIAFLLISLLAGCELVAPGAPNVVSFTTDRRAYALGEEVIAKLENDTDQVIGYNLCYSTLERRIERGWESINPGRVCAAILLGLRPEKSDSYREKLGEELPTGEYRIKIAIESTKSRERAEIFTNSFSVTR